MIKLQVFNSVQELKPVTDRDPIVLDQRQTNEYTNTPMTYNASTFTISPQLYYPLIHI